jgi:hypothetical protein
MICSNIAEMIGFACLPLSEDGSVAMIQTPFAFPDGDGIPVFVEKLGGQVRFFDDGGVLMHFRGKGVLLDDQRKTRFVRNLGEPNGVTLNEMGELEIWARSEEATVAFAKYISTVLALSNWEREQDGVATDTSLFLDEVAMYLRAWKSTAPLSVGEEIVGVSGHVYKMDLQFDGGAVLAVGTHPASISSTAKKLLDIRGATENAGLKVLIVMDDRHDPDTARREGLVLDSVGSVMMMTRLEASAQIGHLSN